MTDIQLMALYQDFQDLKSVSDKIQFLKDKKSEIEKKYDIRVDNLIKSWENQL